MYVSAAARPFRINSTVFFASEIMSSTFCTSCSDRFARSGVGRNVVSRDILRRVLGLLFSEVSFRLEDMIDSV